MAKKEKNKSMLLKIVSNSYVKTFLGIVVAIVLLVIFILFGLNIYTKHGETVAVPAVQGLQVEEAAAILKKSSLAYEVVDSVFLTDGVPGAIIDQVPEENSNVKKDRIIFLRIQAKSVEMITLPMLRDFSQRQAVATLNSLGFPNVTINTVPSAYRGLVIDIAYKGRSLEANDRLPKGAPITLTVGAGGEVIIDSLIDIIPQVDPMDLQHQEAPSVDNSFFD